MDAPPKVSNFWGAYQFMAGFILRQPLAVPVERTLDLGN